MQDFFSKIDQENTLEQLNERGFVRIPDLLPEQYCNSFINGYTDDLRYRSTINMARYNFGEGQYRYFSYPLPSGLGELRSQSYAFLLPLARKWARDLQQDIIYPDCHEGYLELCHQAGQNRPTPLILRYNQGDYNCLHQDLYGDLFYPLQLIVMLNKPGSDFDGGELVLTEQRPRMQSRAHVIKLQQGEGVFIAVNERPKLGARGYYRVKMRHGVSEITKGTRYTMGVVLHDAK